jgi:hypothetical protein
MDPLFAVINPVTVGGQLDGFFYDEEAAAARAAELNGAFRPEFQHWTAFRLVPVGKEGR